MLLPEPGKENSRRPNIFLFFNIKVLFIQVIALLVDFLVAVATVSVVYTSMGKSGRVPLFNIMGGKLLLNFGAKFRR